MTALSGHLVAKYPVIPSQIRRSFGRPDRAGVEAIAAHPVTDVSDLVGVMYTLSGVRPLYEGCPAICGVAVTVKCPPGDNLGVLRAITMLSRGDVLVIDARGFDHYSLGGFQVLKTAVANGALGLIVNGGFRDALDAQEARLALYGTAISPGTGPKSGPLEINVPVCCGGVIVQPGDVVSASPDGIVVVPRPYVPLVADKLGASARSGTSSLDPAREAEWANKNFDRIARFVDDAFAAGAGVFHDD